MGKTSKLNLVLILITILSLGITVGILIKYRTSKNNDITKEMTVASEAEPELTNESVEESESYDTPMAEVEPLPESEMASLSNPFDSLDSPETGEFVKSLLKEHFAYQVSQSHFGTVPKPFNDKLRNLPSSIDYSQYGYGKAPPPPEVQKILKNFIHFPYDVIESVISNFQLVNCEKGVSYNSKIMYTCNFILPTLDGTGLTTQGHRIPNDFKVEIIQYENGYRIESFE